MYTVIAMPGSTIAIAPLARKASPHIIHAEYIHRRLLPAAVASSCAMRNAHSAAVRSAVSVTSRVTNWFARK